MLLLEFIKLLFVQFGSCRVVGIPFYIGMIAPFVLIYVFNWIIFVIITISILCKNCHGLSLKGSRNNQKSGISSRQEFMITVILSVLFGLGWGIGLLATEKLNSTLIRDMFSSLFVIVTSFHGLLIFILQCARSKEARKEWAKWFLKATKRDFLDFTSSAFDYFHYHHKTSPSQLPFQASTSKTTEMIASPPSIACPCSSTTSDQGILKLGPMKHHELGKVLDQEATQEGVCVKTMEAEMETELTKVDLAEMEAKQANLSTLSSAATSPDQRTHSFQEESVALIVHVPDDGYDDPKDIVLDIQGASMTATEIWKSDPPQSNAGYGKQTQDDMETEKVQELHPASFNEAEKDARKVMQQLKAVGVEDGKHDSEEVECEEIRINDFTGDEVPATNVSLEAVMSDQD